MDDYLQNPIIKDQLKYTRENLNGIISKSEKYRYEPENDLIVLSKKPQRRVIVIRDVPSEFQSIQAVRRLFETSLDKNYEQKIQKIEPATTVPDLFFVYFNTEEEAIETFRWIEDTRQKNPKVNHILYNFYINLKYKGSFIRIYGFCKIRKFKKRNVWPR